MVFTSDGGYLIAGNSSGNFHIMKVGVDNFIDWEYTYDGQSVEDIYDVIEIPSGYVVAGFTISSGIGEGDALVMKINPDGSIAWQKTLGHLKADRFNSVAQTSDNGFLLTGSTVNLDPRNDSDGLVVRLNSDGSLAWQRSFGGIDADQFIKGIELSDGKILLFGYTSSFGISGLNPWVIKLNPEGTVLWEKTYSGKYALYNHYVTGTQDGGYIIAGMTYGEVSSVTTHNGYLLKINGDGEIVWQESYGFLYSDMFIGAKETFDGGVIAVGMLGLPTSGDNDAWVLKFDLNMNLEWQKRYGGSGSESFRNLVEYIDGYTFIGQSDSSGPNQSDWFFVTTDEEGNIGDCEYFSDANALTSDIGTISETTSTADIQDSELLLMDSSLTQIGTTLPITHICLVYPFEVDLYNLKKRGSCDSTKYTISNIDSNSIVTKHSVTNTDGDELYMFESSIAQAETKTYDLFDMDLLPSGFIGNVLVEGTGEMIGELLPFPPCDITVEGPDFWDNRSYTFTARVSPEDVLLPLTITWYEWNSETQDWEIIGVGEEIEVSWKKGGYYVVYVIAENEVGSTSVSFWVYVDELFEIFLPLVIDEQLETPTPTPIPTDQPLICPHNMYQSQC
jgi:hypothetical protein